MKRKYLTLALLGIFFLSFLIRISFAISQDYYYDDKSYLMLRQIEDIGENKIDFYDELSYSGRTYIYSPIYQYILSGIHKLLPNYGIKIFINIVAALISIVIFYITLNITKNVYIALFTSFTSIFIPVFMKNTFNTVSNLSLVFLLMLFGILKFMTLKKNKSYLFIITVILLGLISPLSVIFVSGLILYFVISYLTSIKVTKPEKEATIFSVFFIFWTQFLLYKNAFLEHGISVIWQNLPQGILEKHFISFSVPEAVYQIGFILFLTGIYVLYKNLFSEKNKGIMLFFSFCICTLTFLLLKMIPHIVGLIFLGLIMSILFGYFLSMFFMFIKRIFLSGYNTLFVLIFVVIIVIGSVIPALIEVYSSIQEHPNKADIDSFIWLKNNIQANESVLTPVSQGHLLSYFSRKKNIMDTNFLLIDKVDEKFQSVNDIYSTVFKNNAIREINKMDANYIAFTNLAKSEYNIQNLVYLEDDCFIEKYNKSGAQIYESVCIIK